MTDIERAQAQAAIDQLVASDRGTAAVRGLSAWLRGSGFGLDRKNQSAVLQLLTLAWWSTGRGTVCEMIDTAAGRD